MPNLFFKSCCNSTRVANQVVNQNQTNNNDDIGKVIYNQGNVEEVNKLHNDFHGTMNNGNDGLLLEEKGTTPSFTKVSSQKSVDTAKTELEEDDYDATQAVTDASTESTLDMMLNWLTTRCCDSTNVDKVSNGRDKFDFLAPSVYHLETCFLEEIKQSGLGEDATLYDIENLRGKTPGIIRKKGMDVKCPIDGDIGAAYVHCIKGKDHVGTATHMLSYAWSYKFKDIVDTLVSHCEENKLDKKRTYIWMCALCNNQHRVIDREVPFEEFHDVFQKRVKGIGNILAMMTPWNDPAYLKRVWCIFELYSSYSDEQCSVQIIMPPREKKRLMSSVTKPVDANGRNGIDELFKALANTKVETANASLQSDKEHIIRLVEEGPGCYEFNVEVNKLLRLWIRDTVLDAASKKEADLSDKSGNYEKQEIATFLSFCATYFSESGNIKEALALHKKALDIYKTLPLHEENTKELMARCYNNMGTEYETLGQYELSLENHQKCRAAFEEIYGKDHENTSTSYFNIGAVYRKLGRIDEALEMHKTSLEIDKAIKGKDHVDVALGYSYIARISMEKEDYVKAQEMFEESLRIRMETKGPNHPDTAIGYTDIGLLLHAKGDYDGALEMHMKSVAISESVHGKLHPDTGSIYQNIGGAHYEKFNYKEALKYAEKAKATFAAAFGLDHPKTKVAQEWVDIIIEAMNE